MLVPGPAIDHHELPDSICDYGTWLRRGWCKLKFVLENIPSVVVVGSP